MLIDAMVKYDNKDLERYGSKGSAYLVMAGTEWLDIDYYSNGIKFNIPQTCIKKNGLVKKYIDKSIKKLGVLLKIKSEPIVSETVDKAVEDMKLRKHILLEKAYLESKGVTITIKDYEMELL